ncbi:hypothetical protein C4580_02280 [Candidatus Woesearchaeota archaeon]|nr:MAG: hypothetical protein C4580_02280 [Candidatus Woesearchaeota archaeon]
MKWIAIVLVLSVLVAAQDLDGSQWNSSAGVENKTVAVVPVAGISHALFERAREAYLNATLDVEQLRSEGLPYQSLEDRLFVMNESLVGRDEAKLLQTATLLNQSLDGRAKAQEYFRMINLARQQGLKPGQDFRLVIREAEAIRLEKNRVFELRDLLAALEAEVAASEAGNSSSVVVSLEKTKEAFLSERYGEFGVRYNETRLSLEDAEVALARERALTALAGRTIGGFVLKNWRALLVALAVLAVLGVWGYLEWRYVFAQRKFSECVEGIGAVKESMLAAQRDYYAGKLSRATYAGKVAQLHEKERDLKAKRGVWQARKEAFRRTALLARFKSG